MIKFAFALLLSILLCGEHLAMSCALPPTPSQRRASMDEQPLRPAQQDPAVSFEAIDQVMWWLPENTETVLVARSPFKVITSAPEPPQKLTMIKRVELTLQLNPAGCFQKIADAKFYKQLAGHTVSFMVSGSRKFRPPTSLGATRYEGCDVTVFQPGLGPARVELINQMRARAVKVEEIGGQRVMMFAEKFEEDDWKLFVALPQPDVLLCATDRGFLSEMLNRMQQKGARRALPETLPEWKHVDTGAKFWAVRHYDKAEALFDATSPLSGKKAAANQPDTEAVGVAFDFDPPRSKAATIKYLSANKDALAVATRFYHQPTNHFTPKIRQAEPGVIEILVTFNDPEEYMFILILYAALGHALYL